MTRKDYRLIAAVFRTGYKQVANNDYERAVVAVMVDRLAEALTKENPRFDREKFLKACGVKVCENDS